MAKPHLHIKSADEAEAVFYEAFMHGDMAVISALWAEEHVICVHPGSGIISGHDAVIRSWRHILENASPTSLRYRTVNKTATADLAVHMVVEEILDNDTTVALVIATNVYRKFAHGWMMLEHHASLMQQSGQGRTLQ
jgi:hypothetical protein